MYNLNHSPQVRKQIQIYMKHTKPQSYILYKHIINKITMQSSLDMRAKSKAKLIATIYIFLYTRGETSPIESPHIIMYIIRIYTVHSHLHKTIQSYHI